MRFARPMTGLAAPMRRRLLALRWEELDMRSHAKILRQIAMAAHTDFRPDIATLLLLRGARGRLSTHETPSHPRADEYYQQEYCAIAWHLLSFPPRLRRRRGASLTAPLPCAYA